MEMKTTKKKRKMRNPLKMYAIRLVADKKSDQDEAIIPAGSEGYLWVDDNEAEFAEEDDALVGGSRFHTCSCTPEDYVILEEIC
jgi:hypothetical protein